jgi:hypothetical protein
MPLMRTLKLLVADIGSHAVAVSAEPARARRQVSVWALTNDVLFAGRGCGRRVGRVDAGRPGRTPSNASAEVRLAEMVGDGRPWTVLMISELSMPWR